METPAPSRPAAPAVVAVMVTRNPGPWFDDSLSSLAAQDYSNLAVLVVDAASDTDPTARVASVLPDAYVLRLEENAGFGAAANRVREVVDGAAFYCFLHDDAAPTPGAITTMVGEALRSNAGVVGSKLVQWDDERRLLQVGESADKTGERASTVEPGELDQEQHDAVRDVFVVPGACTLVRSDLFEAIGGYDEGIDLLNDDLSLCWRAHVAGGRVVVAPDAVVRHLEALGDRSPVEERRSRVMRHRIRTMLICYGRWHRIRVVPQALLVSVLEVLYSVVVGRRGQAVDVIRAWRWNLQRRDDIKKRHQEVQAFRTVPDNEIRRLQLRGSARVVRFVRGQNRGGSRSDRIQQSLRRGIDGVRNGSLRWPIAAWTVTVAIVVFGSRHLIFQPVAAVGGFAPFDASPADLFRVYLSGWRDVGLGSESPAPTAFGLLGLLGVLFVGAMGTLRQVLIIGSLAAGLIGAYRLLRPARSVHAQAVALVVYGATPLAYDAIASADWGALTIYGATPWILSLLARIGGFAPFVDHEVDEVDVTAPRVASTARIRGGRGRIVALGLLLALVAAIDPAIVPIVVAVVVGLAVGSLLVGATVRATRLVVGSAAGLALAIVLHVPWAFEFILPGATWDMVVGPRSPVPLSLAELLRFDVGPVGGSRLLVGIPIAALLPLFIARDWRFDWAVRAWCVALSLFGLVWADAQGWLPVATPSPVAMLAPAAMAFGVAVAMGVIAFESDLREHGFGWRQVAAVAAGVALIVGALPTVFDAGNGRWYLPSSGLERAFAFFEDDDPGFRVLWLGDPDVLPISGYRLSDEVSYATSDDGLPSLTDQWPGSPQGSTQLVEDSIRAAADGQTTRLGRMLAPMAVRYIVLPSAAAPRPLGGVQRPVDPELVDTLAGQLNLVEIAVNSAYIVYRNEAVLPARSTIAPDGGGGTVFDVSAADLEGAAAVLDERTGDTTFEGPLDGGSTVLHSAAAAGGWRLEVDGRAVPRTKLFGWADGYEVADSGQGVLRYDTSPLRYGMVLVQIAFWALALVALQRSTRVRGTPLLPTAEVES
ncbi:glycosyltransferase family 2 protein [Actinospongicola halichondriae]|uniref:glycosyltransferase family 2 protein n=1 Tax=Actinospongicola halichondriae TaxID=3236844 RepID=UPI003D507F1B